ncbi:MAG: NUDIX domain-containing protein, partial [Nannocystaceae bacterium]|nr:NUDIX domain-containing protein [Nannocystaceae bacterium]
MARAPFQVLVLPYRRAKDGLEVAVFRRADYDVWQFVSGGGEAGESPETAARREVAEEAGVSTTGIITTEIIALDAMTTIPGCWFRAWAD